MPPNLVQIIQNFKPSGIQKLFSFILIHVLNVNTKSWFLTDSSDWLSVRISCSLVFNRVYCIIIDSDNDHNWIHGRWRRLTTTKMATIRLMTQFQGQWLNFAAVIRLQYISGDVKIWFLVWDIIYIYRIISHLGKELIQDQCCLIYFRIPKFWQQTKWI